MKKKFCLGALMLAILNCSFGQNNIITLQFKADNNGQDGAISLVLDANSSGGIADFSKRIEITFKDNPCTNYIVSKNETNDNSFTLSPKDGNNKYFVNVSDLNKTEISLTAKCDNSGPFKFAIKNQKGNPIGNSAYDFFYKNFPNFKDINKRYNRKENAAYFFFDENGKLIGPAPVNVDADDFIIVYMAVPKQDVGLHTIVVEGDYNPSDLSIRPSDNIASGFTFSKAAPGNELTYITQTFGPFTSDKAQIKIDNDSPVDVRINKLYNVAVGASFISTNLEKPSFDVFPIPGTTDNTIRTVNTGRRTLATFNIIFYWKATVDWVTGKLAGKTNVTRGRDILKEASFFERLNPTFGVSINNDWKENFFFGGNFEFARGGSISAGWHYGKVQELVDKDFVLGQTVFQGTKDDIKLTDTWKWDFFFGITLDTRIFNTLFKRGQ